MMEIGWYDMIGQTWSRANGLHGEHHEVRLGSDPLSAVTAIKKYNPICAIPTHFCLSMELYGVAEYRIWSRKPRHLFQETCSFAWKSVDEIQGLMRNILIDSGNSPTMLILTLLNWLMFMSVTCLYTELNSHFCNNWRNDHVVKTLFCYMSKRPDYAQEG